MIMTKVTPSVRITERQLNFLKKLCDAGYYASAAEANRAGILLMMEKYPELANQSMSESEEE